MGLLLGLLGCWGYFVLVLLSWWLVVATAAATEVGDLRLEEVCVLVGEREIGAWITPGRVGEEWRHC